MIANFIHYSLYAASVLYFLGAVGFWFLGNSPMAIAYLCYAVSNIALAQLA